jgi:nitroreductase
MTLAEERYSVRQFKDRAVEQEKVDLILRAAQLARPQ